MASNTGLLVPIDLTGYALGTIDAVQAQKFAGATTWYSQMSGSEGATLGSNVVRAFKDAPVWPMEAGIHLHWAMPDALTHGTQGEDSLDFSALPNRWLLTRVMLQNNKPVTKAWVIISDLLSADRPDNKEAPSLPVLDNSQNFRYLGVSEVFTGSWTEPVIPSTETIQALFGSPINTVASGDIAFASFYPNCRNVFGFYDAMTGVDTSGGVAEAMYTLVGWFNESSHDPMDVQPSLEQLQKQYKWSCNNYPDPAPDYSLYHGEVEGLEWNPDSRHISNNADPVKTDVAIGNNPSETLAAYFNGLNDEQSPHFDTLFTGFEIGALTDLQQPQPGQWSALQETLQAAQFNGLNGGTIYTVQAPQTDGSVVGDIDPPLSLALADALNLLNQYQQEFDLSGNELRQYYWQIFAGWYRIIEVTPADSDCAYNALSTLLNMNTSIQNNYGKAESNLNGQKSKVMGMLSRDMELLVRPGLAFQTPNEPTVLFAGNMCEAPRRYGGDNQHDETGYLICRLNGDTITELSVDINGVKLLNAGDFNGVETTEPKSS